jgi:hypothetical protein
MSEKKPSPNDKYWELVRLPAARTYFFIGASGLGVVALATFLFSSPIAAAVLAIAGICGLVLRWTAMPVVYFISLVYFSIAPLGVPEFFDPYSKIPSSYLNVFDLVVVGGSLVYLFAQYRLYSIIHAGMPFDAKKYFLKSTAKPLVRPSGPLPDAELGRFFLRLAVYLVAGQAIWFLLTNLRVDLDNFPPLSWIPSQESQRNRMEGPMLLSERGSRFVLSVGITLGVAFLLRFALWYWHLLRMGREQGELILLDTEWQETRRELNRQEKWRGDALDRKPTLARPGFGCGSVVLVILGPLAFVFCVIIAMCCGGIR